MQVYGKHYRTIWIDDMDPEVICIIDQTKLPFEFVVKKIYNYKEMAYAISNMEVRGAGLIGAAGAYAMYLATLEAKNESNTQKFLYEVASFIKNTRPTAINLEWAVDRMLKKIISIKTKEQRERAAYNEAQKIADEDAEFGRLIGTHGLPLIEAISKKKNGDVVNILTHCNAGWLALVDYGTALSPIYAAHEKGIKLHVWVDETRPRNQGANLTAWELRASGVPHTIIADNTGGHLMQHGLVDMCIVGSDRTTYTGDVCNKIGTYLKALAANDNNIPFFVAVYSSSFDWDMKNGITDIPIEQRTGDELRWMRGINKEAKITETCIIPEDFNVCNYAFDVTPARLITALITERGICKTVEEDILRLFPEKSKVKTPVKMPVEGVIKFNYKCLEKNFVVKPRFYKKVNKYRNLLKINNFIGQYSNGLCYGNISIRRGKSKHFLITSSDTGKIQETLPEHYVEITHCDISGHLCYYKGSGLPSSEALSHFILYNYSREINAVIHLHNKELWKKLKNKVPASSSEVEYGTREMVEEILRLLENTDLSKKKILVMGGHEDGIICFGESPEEAWDTLMRYANC